MVYNSLTEAPHNLKEGIDWLIAVKGTAAKSNLAAMGAAVHKFLVDKPVGHTVVPALEVVKLNVKDFMDQNELKNMPYVKELRSRYSSPVRKYGTPFFIHRADESIYKNIVKTRKMRPDIITNKVTDVVYGCEKFLNTIKVDNKYESAYSSEATWEKSCSEKPEDCAAVFVGIAPMLCAGLRSLRIASDSGSLSCLGKSKTNVGNILSALGYNDPKCIYNSNASYVYNALKNLRLRMFLTLYDLSGFWAFYGSNKIEAVREKPVDPVIPEAEPSVDGEGEQSVIPEAEPSVDGEGEQSVIPEVEPSVDGEGEQSVIPEVEPSVEPVQPEVDDVEQPVKVAKAADVVKSAKKAARKVSKKALQNEEKQQRAFSTQ
ncbi:hypothetical protein BBBOND_0312430 [Babesia bigemina]|uniref:Uncharacterized protein n=1 Tax=Babesia bigemina TaxID=5866 RepID=A0A061DEI5_BABBI|nr:hypothetical protein BBBOND_0312430 [Babesia bigemina]CDR97340.1 hypothetical protein BBBOND_0312430 [Babesia bigemina]|eukprot:XP_012769526.1 hypothetical protein BBBOND_0312430 [Babesia bigemina]